MAEVAGTITRVDPGRDTWMVTWLGLGDADTGSVIAMPMGNEKSVQLTGTFASATVVLEGSNDGTNFVTLTDPQGNALSATAAMLEGVAEHTRYIRPSTSGGSGTDVNVYLFVKGQTT